MQTIIENPSNMKLAGKPTLKRDCVEIVPQPTKTTRKEANQRQTAEPIKFILDRETRAVVGWLYKWNTGALVPMWKDGKCQNVIYE